MQVIIDTDSRDEAQLLAGVLPGRPAATSVRGYGMIRTSCRTRRDLDELLQALEGAVQEHELRWARARVGDDEHVFRGRVRRAS